MTGSLPLEPPVPEVEGPARGAIRARRRFRARSGRPQTAPRSGTALGGVERVLLYMIVALRVVNLAQLVPAVAGTLDRSTNPPLEVALAGLFALWSIALIATGLRLGTVRLPWLMWTDVAVSSIVLLGMAFVVQPDLRVNTWDAWAGGVTYSTPWIVGATAAGNLTRIAAAAILTISYLIPTALLVQDPVHALTAWTNALVYPAYILIGHLVTDYLERVAAGADEARRREAVAAAEAETARHRALLHDQATILDLVARGTDDPTLLRALRKQAREEARKVTAFMSSSGDPDEARPEDLGRLATVVAGDFADLRPVVTVDLAVGTTLRGDVAATVRSALTTLLHNVRRHAQAEQCVVHADGEAPGGGWELTVRDDGAGFDPGTTPTGYGLRHQVGEACARHGIAVDVHSAPGEGTTVTLHGPPTTITPAGDRPEGAGHTRGG